MKKAVAGFAHVIVVLFCSCADEGAPMPVVNGQPEEPQVGVDIPPGAMAISMGTFTSYAHGLAGDAVLYETAEDNRILRFNNFTMSSGPDVYVLFSGSNNYSKANTIAISMLKETYSNQSLNFNVPDEIDLSTHPFVLVYCVQYNSLFGYSELEE